MSTYLDHFILADIPFKNTLDSTYFVDLDRSRDVEAALFQCLQGGHGLAVLTGEVGTGKTTLVHHLVHTGLEAAHVFWVVHPPETPEELYQFLLRELEVEMNSHQGKTLLLDRLRAQLALRGLKRPYLLVVDEAHEMPDPVMDTVKYLNDLEHDGQKLLRIVLVGQPEFEAALDKPGHKALAQRISCRRRLDRLTLEQSMTYMQVRLEKAGGELGLFTPSALRDILIQSQGIPRNINNICHDALLCASERKAQVVGDEDVALALAHNRLAPDTLPGAGTGVAASASRHTPGQRPFFPVWAAACLVLAVAGLTIVAVSRHGLLESRIDHPRAPGAGSADYREKVVHEELPAQPVIAVESDHLVDDTPKQHGLEEAKGVADKQDSASLSISSAPVARKADTIDQEPGHLFDQPPFPDKPFAVQFGTFVYESNAHGVYQLWKDKGYPVYQHAVVGATGQERYVVRMGGYDSQEQARLAARLFREREQVPAVTVQVVVDVPTAEAPLQEESLLLRTWPDAFQEGGPVQLYRMLAAGQGRTYRLRGARSGEGRSPEGPADAGFLQVATYHQQDQANRELDRFLAHGWQGSVFSSEEHGGIQHHVLIGPFASQTEAEALRDHARESADALEYVRKTIPTADIRLSNKTWTMVLQARALANWEAELLKTMGWPILEQGRAGVQIGPFPNESVARQFQEMAGQGQGWGPLLMVTEPRRWSEP